MRMPTNQWDFPAGGGGGGADDTCGYGENYDDQDLVAPIHSSVGKERNQLTPRRASDNDAGSKVTRQRLYTKNPRRSDSGVIFVLENIDNNDAAESWSSEHRLCSSVFLSDNGESSSSYSATAATDSRRGSAVVLPATSYGSSNRRRSSGGVSSLLLKGRNKAREGLTNKSCNNNKNISTTATTNSTKKQDVALDYRRMSAPELPPITTSGDNHMTPTLVSARRRTSILAEYSSTSYTPRQNDMKLDTGYGGVSIAPQTARDGGKTTQLTSNTGSRALSFDKGQHTNRSNRSTALRSAVSHGSSSLSRGSDERPQSKPIGLIPSVTKTGISNMKDPSEKFQTRPAAVSGSAEAVARPTPRLDRDRAMLVSRPSKGLWNSSGEQTIAHDRSPKLTNRLRTFFFQRKTSVGGATKATTTPRDGVHGETSSGNTSRHTGSTEAHQPSWSSRKENTAQSRAGAGRMLHHCPSESQICRIQPEPDLIIDNNNTGTQYGSKHKGMKRIHSDQKLAQRLVVDLNKSSNYLEKNKISIDRTERLVQKHRHGNLDVSGMRRYSSTSVLNQNVRPQTIMSVRTGASNTNDDVEGYDSENENDQRIFNWLLATDGAEVPPDPEITYSEEPPQRDTAIHIVYDGD